MEEFVIELLVSVDAANEEEAASKGWDIANEIEEKPGVRVATVRRVD